jgi:hypothetical protein
MCFTQGTRPQGAIVDIFRSRSPQRGRNEMQLGPRLTDCWSALTARRRPRPVVFKSTWSPPAKKQIIWLQCLQLGPAFVTMISPLSPQRDLVWEERSADNDQLIHATAARGHSPRELAFSLVDAIYDRCPLVTTIASCDHRLLLFSVA